MNKAPENRIDEERRPLWRFVVDLVLILALGGWQTSWDRERGPRPRPTTLAGRVFEALAISLCAFLLLWMLYLLVSSPDLGGKGAPGWVGYTALFGVSGLLAGLFYRIQRPLLPEDRPLLILAALMPPVWLALIWLAVRPFQRPAAPPIESYMQENYMRPAPLFSPSEH